MNQLRAELHVHTVLSPCADVEMIPPLIVQEALDRGIQVIAITDHNATANIEAVQKAARGTGLSVLPGMEVQTVEEVHSLCLFDSLDQAFAWQAEVDKTLPAIENQPEHFGEQFVVDETGDFIRRENQLLLTSCSLSIDDAFQKVTGLGGLFIPAHVNRKAFGLLEILGFVPPEIPFLALEISRHISPDQARARVPQLHRYPLLQNGDAHFLNEISGFNLLTIETASVQEIRLALRNEGDRSFQLTSL